MLRLVLAIIAAQKGVGMLMTTAWVALIPFPGAPGAWYTAQKTIIHNTGGDLLGRRRARDVLEYETPNPHTEDGTLRYRRWGV